MHFAFSVTILWCRIKSKNQWQCRLLSTTVPDEFRCRIPVFRKTVDEQTQLLNFVGPETWFLLKVLRLEESWLYLSPELWSTSGSYQTGKRFFTKVKVVNGQRGGGEDTTFEAKDSEKVRGQGQDQGPSCRGQFASRPRTERLEVKAKDSRTRLKIRANINVNIVIMISQALKCKIEKNGLNLSLLTSLF